MGNRVDLQTTLESTLGSGNVYFQPPESVRMKHPCIVYALSDIDTTFANDNPYSHKKRYMITLIDKNPDSDITDKLANLPKCSFQKRYSAENLNHDVFNIYY